MLFQFSAYGMHLIFLSIIIIFMIYYIYKNKETTMHSLLLFGGFALFGIIFTYAMVSFLVNPLIKIPFLSIHFLMIIIFFTELFLCGMEYFEIKNLWSRKYLILLSIMPILTIIIVLTDPWTQLLNVMINGPNGKIILKKGIWIFVSYIYAILLSLIMLGYCIKKYPTVPKRNRVAVILLIISTLVVVGGILTRALLICTAITIVPLTAFLTFLLLFAAIFFTRTFDKFPLSWKNFVDKAEVGMVLFDLDKRVVYYNPMFDKIIGLDKDLTGLKITELAAPKPAVDFILTEDEFVEYWDDSRQMWIQVSRSWVYDDDGVRIGENHVISNVTRLKKAEMDAKLNAQEAIEANEENVILLKEIHHRVKNNLQLITSFINLEKKFNNENPDEILDITKKRIDSLALIHERIYNEESMKNIQFGSFINDFDKNLYSLSDKTGITFINDIDDTVKFSVDVITPLILMINELTTNTFKYAFPNGFTRDKNINKSIKIINENNQLFVDFKYKDTGVGLPEDFDFENAKSLGLTIIRSLSGQLDGEYKFYNDNGFCFDLKFPLKED